MHGKYNTMQHCNATTKALIGLRAWPGGWRLQIQCATKAQYPNTQLNTIDAGLQYYSEGAMFGCCAWPSRGHPQTQFASKAHDPTPNKCVTIMQLTGTSKQARPRQARSQSEDPAAAQRPPQSRQWLWSTHHICAARAGHACVINKGCISAGHQGHTPIGVWLGNACEDQTRSQASCCQHGFGQLV